MRLKILVQTTIIFLLTSCTILNGENPDESGRGPHRRGDSSEQLDAVYGVPVAYGNETYRTIVIGEQVWMARNLNYDASGSKCYDNQDSNCVKYGRLYDWKTAMDLEYDCNFVSCESKISYNHRGICPEGWHIPSKDEWKALARYIESSKGCDSCAARYLKSARGWDKYNEQSGNGSDSYGFSAVPSGVVGKYGFSGVGWVNQWWSASEDYYNAPTIRHDRSHLCWGDCNSEQDRRYAYSVRCLQNSSSVPSSSSSQTGTIPGSPVDYEGEIYNTVVIGTQTWMARNLNYNASDSRCYDNQDSNCVKYGKLYDWTTAMALPSICNISSCSGQIQQKHKGICPSGWHIPSKNDWEILLKFINPECSLNAHNVMCENAGIKLKATSGWGSYVTPATDKYGFSALPGGIYSSGGTKFSNIGYWGWWWSTGEESIDNAYSLGMGSNIYTNGSIYTKKDFLSVRCVKD